MKKGKFFLSILIYSSLTIASQTVTSVELSRDNGIIFNESGEISIIKERWNGQQKFDFSLELGNCPTVCGAVCPLNILSKNKFYIYKNKQDSIPLYGHNVDFQNDGFDTSTLYLQADTIQFFSIPLTNYPKYMVFKATVNKYLLFIIDSLKISGGCPPEMPACCTAYGIDKIYGKIIFQDNGLPYFDQPVNVERKQLSNCYKTKADISNRVIDIQGRSFKKAVNSSGVRINASVNYDLNKKRVIVKTNSKWIHKN